MSTQSTSKHTMHRVSDTHFRALEGAREAILKLKTLKPLLTPRDEETLGLLMDNELMAHLAKSLKEEEEGKTEPLKNILK